MSHPWFAPTGRPRVLAHRGLVTPEGKAQGIAENSFAAVAAAHAVGVDYVESDCHLTSDGAVVLFHDDTLERIAGDPRRLAQVTRHELEAIMSDRGGLITLEQALDSFPQLRFNIDVKADAAAVAAGRIIAAHSDRVLLTSFSDARRRRALAAAREAGGQPATSPGRGIILRAVAAVAVGATRSLDAALRHVDAIQVPVRWYGAPVFTRRLLRAAHARGVEVHVWTVNDPEMMRRLRDIGVDGLVTDRADIAWAIATEPRPEHRL